MKWNKNAIFELIIVIVSAIAIILNFYLFKDWRGVLYYTIISNILVFVFLSYIINKKIKREFKSKLALSYNKGIRFNIDNMYYVYV